MADNSLSKEQKVKQMNRVVCICKGINLGSILGALKNSDTVSEVYCKIHT